MTETSTGIEAFEALMQEKKDLEQQIKEKAQGVFAEQAKAIFEKHGDVVDTFGWTQYTPYFNDGEPCEFTKYELFIWSKKDRGADEDAEHLSYYENGEDFSGYGKNSKVEPTLWDWKREYQPYSYGNEPKKPVEINEHTTTYAPGVNNKAFDVKEYPNPNYDPAYGEAYAEISKLYNLIDEDTSLALFGDHCVVIVDRDGARVEEHEHE